MKCPKCNGKTVVVCTENERNSVVRKRRCCKCSYVFYTQENESEEAHERFKISNKTRYAKYEAAKSKIKRKTNISGDMCRDV